jgi:hypothetical protein
MRGDKTFHAKGAKKKQKQANELECHVLLARFRFPFAPSLLRG